MDSAIDFVVLRSTPANRVTGWALLAFCMALISVPWWGDASLMRWMVEVICFLVLAQMWNLMAGYGGLISVGQQAFVGLGGYGLFVLAQHLRINPFLAVPLAGVAAAILAVPMSKLVFRLRGGYFAVGTWVVSEVCRIWVSNLSLVGGGSGQSLTVMASIQRDVRESVTYWMACALLIVTFATVYGLLRSRFGLGLTAIRDSEAAAESQGVRVATLKFQVYVLSALGTAMVGGVVLPERVAHRPRIRFRSGVGCCRHFYGGDWRHRHARRTHRRGRSVLLPALVAVGLWQLVLAGDGGRCHRRHGVFPERPVGLHPATLGGAGIPASEASEGGLVHRFQHYTKT